MDEIDVDDILSRLNSRLAMKYKSKAPELFLGTDLPAAEWLSTGLLAYDYINGGGAPKGHLEQIYGARSSGKTTVVLRRAAECQRQNGVVAFIDAEHTLDRDWAAKQGVDLKKLVLLEPDLADSAEVILTVIIEMLKSCDFDMIVLDSIPAICPQAKMDKGMEDKHYAGVSGILGQFFDKVIGPGILYNSNSVLVFINQPRDTIGSRIPIERLPGGRALGHYSSIITQVKKGDFLFRKVDGGEEKIGMEVRIINQKNKVRNPFREQTLRLHFDTGFNPLYDVLKFAEHYGLVELNGSWMYYDGECLGQGIDNHMLSLSQTPELYFKLKSQILGLIKSGQK